MAALSLQVRQALQTLQGQLRRRLTENDKVVTTITTPSVELQLTQEHLDLMEAAERAVAADERFEHLTIFNCGSYWRGVRSSLGLARKPAPGHRPELPLPPTSPHACMISKCRWSIRRVVAGWPPR
jgi:hypothetical protein